MSKIGLQLYSVKELTENDFLGTLKKIGQLGFDGVEFAGYYNTAAREIKKLMDDYNIQAAGSHISIEALIDNFNQVVDFEKELENPYVVVPYLTEEYRNSLDALKKTVDHLNEIGAKLKENGMQLYYHNHGFEFEKIEGQYILDHIVSATEAENLHVELDTYWVASMNLDPLDFIKKYGKRCSLLHIKDMKGKEDRSSTIVGKGIMDFASITKAGKDLGTKWYTIEQEHFDGDQLDELGQGYLYLKDLLTK